MDPFMMFTLCCGLVALGATSIAVFFEAEIISAAKPKSLSAKSNPPLLVGAVADETEAVVPATAIAPLGEEVSISGGPYRHSPQAMVSYNEESNNKLFFSFMTLRSVYDKQSFTDNEQLKELADRFDSRYLVKRIDGYSDLTNYIVIDIFNFRNNSNDIPILLNCIETESNNWSCQVAVQALAKIQHPAVQASIIKFLYAEQTFLSNSARGVLREVFSDEQALDQIEKFVFNPANREKYSERILSLLNLMMRIPGGEERLRNKIDKQNSLN